MEKRKVLRRLIEQPGMLIVPGAYDCISARLIERAGFPAVYMTGAGVAASRTGLPDYGLTTMTEMAETAGNMANSIRVPLIADADTGFGNELNLARTVREYELRGVAAIQIEDQVFPKKCGHLDQKEVVSREEFLSKVRMAAMQRTDPDFLIVARTDARAVIGFEEAVERMNLAFEAGANVAFLEAPQTVEEIRSVPALLKGPCLLNIVSGGKTPPVSLKDAEAWGYKIALLPAVGVTTVVTALSEVLGKIADEREYAGTSVSVKDFFNLMGMEEWDRLKAVAARPS